MGQHDDRAAPTPKTEIFAEARRRRLEPGDDRFDRFRNEGLIGDLVPIAGTTQRGFTPDQAERFFELLTLCKELRSKRPRASALAFWLCWRGSTDVPPHLVCEHVARCLRSYLRILRRQYERRRVPIRSAKDSERWRKAGMPWAKPFIRDMLSSFIDNGVMLDILATIIGMFLRTLFSQASFEAVATSLSGLAFLFGIKRVEPTTLRKIWDVLAEGMQLFNTYERQNPLLGAVREVREKDPAAIIGLVHDARRVIATMAQVFPMYDVAGAPAIPEPANDSAISLYQKFPPAMVSVLALTRKGSYCIEMLANLRSGNAEPVLQEFHQLRVIRDSALEHIRSSKHD
jgi:hypothetical protein